MIIKLTQRTSITAGIALVLACQIFVPRPAHAVMPPDFIFNIGAQVAQFFSIILAIFSVVLGTILKFFRNRLNLIKHKKIFLGITILSIIFISLLLAYLYAQYQQTTTYRRWLEDSAMHRTINTNISANAFDREDAHDQLNIGVDSMTVNTSASSFVSNIVSGEDSTASFISQYYENIANGNYQQAYAMSKQSVDYPTFKNWYLHTTKITLDKLVRIDSTRSSLELTLFEGQRFTRYGVVMTLYFESKSPVKIADSEVRILGEGSIGDDLTIHTQAVHLSEDYEFFNNHQDQPLNLSHQALQSAIDKAQNDYILLDAREDIEFNNGHFPGSTHIRFADLKAGRWIELPQDKFIYVICWSGIRGQEVADFLRTKNLAAAYLENGASGWVEAGGLWQGTVQFSAQYSAEQYQVVLTTDQVKDHVAAGALLVDTRQPSKFQTRHITGSVNIPMMYTPTVDQATVFNQVPPGSTVITICDDYVNCFDAKITGIELEHRGNIFLGRYNRPWEYEE